MPSSSTGTKIDVAIRGAQKRQPRTGLSISVEVVIIESLFSNSALRILPRKFYSRESFARQQTLLANKTGLDRI